MSTERGYLNDPFQLEFQADVIEQCLLGDGRQAVLLSKTYFYPTGGGQDHDTGTLGPARVIDVFPDDAENVIHVADREVSGSGIPARIDAPRRLENMRHHSAQHLLSAAIEQSLGLQTISAHISSDAPCTIDLPTTRLSEADLVAAEDLANSIIREDRNVKSYFITDADISTIPFRRPPKVSGNIRVVEIEDFDHSACGGTHCTRSGMIGVVKVLKAERRGDLVRVHFVAGERALRYFQDYHRTITQVGLQLSTGAEGLVEAIGRQQDALRSAQKQIEDLEELETRRQARDLVAKAEPLDSLRVVLAWLHDRTPQQLRMLASLVQKEPGVVALLAAFDGTRLALAVAAAEDTAISANALIRKQLAQIGGRGGGDNRLAQGGGAADEKQCESFFINTREYIRELKSSS